MFPVHRPGEPAIHNLHLGYPVARQCSGFKFRIAINDRFGQWVDPVQLGQLIVHAPVIASRVAEIVPFRIALNKVVLSRRTALAASASVYAMHCSPIAQL